MSMSRDWSSTIFACARTLISALLFFRSSQSARISRMLASENPEVPSDPDNAQAMHIGRFIPAVAAWASLGRVDQADSLVVSNYLCRNARSMRGFANVQSRHSFRYPPPRSRGIGGCSHPSDDRACAGTRPLWVTEEPHRPIEAGSPQRSNNLQDQIWPESHDEYLRRRLVTNDVTTRLRRHLRRRPVRCLRMLDYMLREHGAECKSRESCGSSVPVFSRPVRPPAWPTSP